MSREPAAIAFVHAREVLTCAGPAPKRGAAQGDAGAIADGAIATRSGRIVAVGPTAAMLRHLDRSSTRIVDLAGSSSIVPGFVDPHTHAVFAGDRRDEVRRRLAGETYADIARAGGGIAATVAATRGATEDELVAATRPRLDEMLRCGTTTCEIKSGYGLTAESELTQLRAIRTLSRTHPLSIVPTFLGAHSLPPDWFGGRKDYVDLVVQRMIPMVAGARLAAWCDVFCDVGFFTPDESTRILEAARELRMGLRIHADELASSGGARVAAAVGARSADHLVFVSDEDIRLLADAGVTATLLPIAAFYLKLGRCAPARALIEAGVPVALATDVNPGGGLSPSMPFAMALACFTMGLTFEEALVAATLNAAWSLDVAGEAGSIEPGKAADLAIVEGDAINLLRVGTPAVSAVIKAGALVHGVLP